MTGEDRCTVLAEINSLADLSLEDLRARWRDLYRSAPPVHMSCQVLMQAIAYRLQENQFGGLSRSAKMKLKAAAKGAGREVPSSRRAPPRYRIKPGTRLLREWQGRSHEVVAIGEGKFQYRGDTYSSLSEIARKITGTRWSGPAFFGLNRRAGG